MRAFAPVTVKVTVRPATDVPASVRVLEKATVVPAGFVVAPAVVSVMPPFRTGNTYRPSWPAALRVLLMRPVAVLLSSSPPFIAEPGSSSAAVEPFEYPARAEKPPSPAMPPLASPVSHCTWS